MPCSTQPFTRACTYGRRHTHEHTPCAVLTHFHTCQITLCSVDELRGRDGCLSSLDQHKAKVKGNKSLTESHPDSMCVCVYVCVCLFILAPPLSFFSPVCVSIWHIKCMCVCVLGGWNLLESARVPAPFSAPADGKSLWILANGQFVVTTATTLAPSILPMMMFEERPAFSTLALSNGSFDWRHA